MLTGLILDSYTDSQVKVVTLNGATNQISIKRCVKQGCPFSSILFDICIDPLIEKLSSDEFKKYGFWWSEEDGVTAQAYADDILLFSDSYEHMLKLVEVVQDFIRQSNIQLNPTNSKCCKSEKTSILHSLFWMNPQVNTLN
jgi:hypothetical protein